MGKKGEIYTTKELRKKMGLKANQKLKAVLSRDGKKLVIETLPSLEEVLKRKPLFKITPEEAEKISEHEQKRHGIYEC
jgi:bifunctional DNA-binding transcriptional regulator/antitoxin component of YhaV-PrlF toxin-antitoxin module